MRATFLVVETLIHLVRHDAYMGCHSFSSLHQHIRDYPTSTTTSPVPKIGYLSHAVDVACSLYPKQVLCLQRSAVLVKMLRKRGVSAHLIIGAQKLPFKAHAWVEVDGMIINDRLASRETFLVMEVC